MSHPEDGDGKLAVAQEVIVSAGNILVAAGFRRDEIAGFFRQAADQLASLPGPGEPVRAPSPAQSTGGVPSPGFATKIRAGFAEIAPVRALADIAVDPQTVARLRDGAEPARPHLDLALQMLPRVAEAQDWLRETAREAGLTLVANRQHWLATAPPEALAAVEQMLFLDDFEAACKPCFDFVGALAAAMVRANDEDALNILLRGLVSCGIILTHDLKVELEAGVQTLIPRGIAAV